MILFFEWFFLQDSCFSKGLQSTIPGEYSDLMVGLTSREYVGLDFGIVVVGFLRGWCSRGGG